jgi:dethiobiotin synthase
MNALIVTGTDTGVGKTVVSAMLTLALNAYYWKPIQSGLGDATDTQTVASLTGMAAERVLPERYRLNQPLSPHRAAELDGVEIDWQTIDLPSIPPDNWLVVEGAGGVLVPLTRAALQIELFARWKMPVIVVARTALGTINHTLLPIDTMKRRSLPVHGIIFVGDDMPDTQRTIAEFSGERILGRIPVLQRIDAAALCKVFETHFRRMDFQSLAPADAAALGARLRGRDRRL